MAEKLRILFLDDRSKRIHAAQEKYTGHDLTIVTTAKECIEKISNETWDQIRLDHDLNYESFVDSDRPDCGMEVVRFIEKYINYLQFEGTTFWVHTSNRAAGLMMADKLEILGLDAYYKRFEYE